jgi:hypothetical protein
MNCHGSHLGDMGRRKGWQRLIVWGNTARYRCYTCVLGFAWSREIVALVFESDEFFIWPS